MTYTLVVRQLRHHALMLAAICGGLFGFELLMVWISSSMAIGPDFHALLGMLLPPAMLKFVMSQFGFASFAAAVAFGFKHPLVLITAAAFPIVAGSIPAAERESGLLDLILARPVPRERYLIAHVLLLAAGVLLIPLALLIGAAAGLTMTGRTAEVAWTSYIAPAASLAPLMLLIGAYTMFFAAGARRRGGAVGPAIALTLVFFWYDVVASMWSRLEGYEWATIFYYYAPVQILNGERGMRDPLVLLGAALVLFIAAFIRFRRQQL